jgi:hypothetical protein
LFGEGSFRAVTRVKIAGGEELRIDDSDVAVLRELPDVEEVEITGAPSSPFISAKWECHVTDEGLALLKSLGGLRSLRVTAAPVTGAFLRHLPQVTSIEELNLYETDVNDEALQEIGRCVALESLCLNDTGITDLEPLASLTQLRWLAVDGTAIDDADLDALCSLPLLEELFIGNTQCTSAGLACVERLSRLRLLSLDGTRIDDDAFTHIVLLPNLEELTLGRTRVTDKGIHQLSRLPKLRVLTVDDTSVTEEGIAHLKMALPKLEVYGAERRPPPQD